MCMIFVEGILICFVGELEKGKFGYVKSLVM